MTTNPFEADNDGARKARGAFFTPPAVCRFMSEWAIRSADDRVLEPSAGEAAFLLAAGGRLQDLGGDPAALLSGVELHHASARAASQSLLDAGWDVAVQTGNFFDLAPQPDWDVVIGNPPFIRFQDFAGDDRLRGQEAALGGGVRLSALASSWAAFVVHSARFLRATGRLALVLPAELLSVNYASPVRTFLLERFGKVRLVLFEERVFPGAMTEVVLLLAEGAGPADHFEVVQAQHLGDLERLAEPVRCTPAATGDKWMGALVEPLAARLFQSVSDTEHFEVLAEWGTTHLGMVTGNNGYFALSAKDVARHGLSRADVVPLCPPGSRHLRGLTFTSTAWQTMTCTSAQTYLFTPSSPLSKSASKYIKDGAAQGVNAAYKCRIRQPWWAVPWVQPPDLFLTYMNHDAPRLVTNRARVPHLNSVHGIRLHQGRRRAGADLLPLAMLNSVTLMGAELIGRSYGGGILKVEPREAQRLPMPSPALLQNAALALRAVRPAVASHLRSGRFGEAVKIVDQVMLTETLAMDDADVLALRRQRERLFERRAGRKTYRPSSPSESS